MAHFDLTRIGGGAPTEEAMRLSFEMVLSERLADRFEAECAGRNISPAALMASIIENVISDDLFSALLDD